MEDDAMVVAFNPPTHTHIRPRMPTPPLPSTCSQEYECLRRHHHIIIIIIVITIIFIIIIIIIIIKADSAIACWTPPDCISSRSSPPPMPGSLPAPKYKQYRLPMYPDIMLICEQVGRNLSHTAAPGDTHARSEGQGHEPWRRRAVTGGRNVGLTSKDSNVDVTVGSQAGQSRYVPHLAQAGLRIVSVAGDNLRRQIPYLVSPNLLRGVSPPKHLASPCLPQLSQASAPRSHHSSGFGTTSRRRTLALKHTCMRVWKDVGFSPSPGLVFVELKTR
ncbi:hypothetical protein E2C01_032005 [Portunus trituberculatus]|uniref:Uncharacterized protein n=1 Tax=Portunus trituberculatus TaxID=210409 RepID=A0A5B7EZR8_PORTR|nr:hypothetical protein [Portunus trituberculatus]